MAIRLEREALYRAIWSKPLRAVALDYGLSDTGLRKVCVALNVPMPPRGYWARKAAGQAVESVPLPETDGATTFVSRPQSRTPDQEWRTAEDERWFAERIAFDVSQRETLTVSERPARWHPVVAKLRDLLVEHEAELLKSRAAAERHARLPESRRQREGDSAGYLWRYANDHGQLVFDPSHAFAVRVSIGHFRRALVYLNAVARLAEARGYAVSYDSKEGRIVLDAQPGRVELRMSEKMEKRTRREGSRGDAREVEYLVPTGVLRVFVAVDREAFGRCRIVSVRRRRRGMRCGWSSGCRSCCSRSIGRRCSRGCGSDASMRCTRNGRRLTRVSSRQSGSGPRSSSGGSGCSARFERGSRPRRSVRMCAEWSQRQGCFLKRVVTGGRGRWRSLMSWIRFGVRVGSRGGCGMSGLGGVSFGVGLRIQL
jgi:hypothetical protein